MLIELEDVKKFLNIYYSEDDELLTQIIEEMQDYIITIVKSDYFLDSNKYKTYNNIAKILLKKLVYNSYENRNSYSNFKNHIDTTQNLWNILILNKPIKEGVYNE